MHEVLVNRLGGLSLPRKSVVRLTDRPDMTLDVYRGRKTTMQCNATGGLLSLIMAVPGDRFVVIDYVFSLVLLLFFRLSLKKENLLIHGIENLYFTVYQSTAHKDAPITQVLHFSLRPIAGSYFTLLLTL